MKKLQIKNIDWKNWTYTIFILIIGNILIAIGANCFLRSSNIYPTGLLGFATELSDIARKFLHFHISYSIFFFILNIPIIIFGYLRVGKKFILKTLISVILYTIIAAYIPKIDLSTLKILDPSTGDFLIMSIIAAGFIGTGMGLMLRVGASSGGIDIIAVYISIYKGKTFGIYSLLINTVVLAISYALTFNVILTTLSLVNLYLVNIVIDKIHNSQEKYLLIIITNKANDVTTELSKNLFRGITIIDSIGGYSKNPSNTLFVSISKGELLQARQTINTADDKAFVNVLKADNIFGNFENPYQKIL